MYLRLRNYHSLFAEALSWNFALVTYPAVLSTSIAGIFTSTCRDTTRGLRGTERGDHDVCVEYLPGVTIAMVCGEYLQLRTINGNWITFSCWSFIYFFLNINESLCVACAFRIQVKYWATLSYCRIHFNILKKTTSIYD